MSCRKKSKRPLSCIWLYNQFHPRKTHPRAATSISSLRKDLLQSTAASFRKPGTSPKPKYCVGTAVINRMNNAEETRLRKQNRRLVEENNLLKLKVEFLLDMLAETTAEVHLQENEIQDLRQALNQKDQGTPRRIK